MVGRIFKIVFTRLSNRRLDRITDDLEERASKSTARRVRRDIVKEARKLEKLPGSRPNLPDTEDLEYEVRYAKSRKYKIIFRIFDVLGIVRILSIRHDREDPDDIHRDI
jgi:plasmid stabilization system protein ParE